ncbi:phenylalanine--tRNA ligase beta subunit-related protein [Thermomicrobium sp. 4228-Ro]|uniref:B3/B4 domain-containing protein n=1 Tax=Thermomicrobium sp. 4228-Ro TaxID=2993937 RepID=UPI00224978AB|nr:phenylalanine--tRNA ligase beta subunit-related protein [Thermomicrobium sp. 4228-Ro]MCX2726448.1 phenylalanine--tRNA ligase beta subunit-related protein [Thermomicrobium sp. 4228-Ro]
MSRFRIAREVFERFPDYLVVVLVVEALDNQRAPEQARALLSESIAQAREQYGTRDPKDLPAIAVWRHAFRTLGWSASTYQSSVEALLRRTLKGNPPPSINPTVDLVNAASLRFLVPVGAHDLDTAPEGITVRPSEAGDRFLPLGEGEPEIPEPGEIVYAHDHEVRTRRWVWRQSRIGLVTPETRRVFVPIDAFHGVTADAALEAAEWLAAQFERLLGATIRRDLVDRARPEIVLER